MALPSSRQLLRALLISILISGVFSIASADADENENNSQGLEQLVKAKDDRIADLSEEIKEEKAKSRRELEAANSAAKNDLQSLKDKLERQLEEKERQLTDAKKQVESLRAEASGDKSSLREATEALEEARKSMRSTEAEAGALRARLVTVVTAWLPPWAASRMDILQAKAKHHWHHIARPALANLTSEAAKRASSLQEWSRPHVATVRAASQNVMKASAEALQPVFAYVGEQHQKLRPHVERHLGRVGRAVQPHWAAAVGGTTAAAAAAREAAGPYMEAAHAFSAPYVKVATERGKQVADEWAGVLGPHVAPARDAAARQWRRLQPAVAGYHRHLYALLKGVLEGAPFHLQPSESLLHRLSSTLLAWPAALALFALFWPFIRGGAPPKPAPKKKASPPSRPGPGPAAGHPKPALEQKAAAPPKRMQQKAK